MDDAPKFRNFEPFYMARSVEELARLEGLLGILDRHCTISGDPPRIVVLVSQFADSVDISPFMSHQKMPRFGFSSDDVNGTDPRKMQVYGGEQHTLVILGETRYCLYNQSNAARGKSRQKEEGS